VLHDASAELTQPMISQYLGLLRSNWQDRSKLLIPNRYPWHSRVATGQLLEYAHSKRQLTGESPEIRILTGSLPDFIYSDTDNYERLRSHIEIGGKVKIAVWDNKATSIGGSRLRQLAENSDRLEIRFSGTVEEFPKLSHFLVVGDDAYRLEVPHPKVDQSKVSDFSPECPAMICFNNKEIGTRLVEMFDSLWDIIHEQQVVTEKA
jgi:hypothetical protein